MENRQLNFDVARGGVQHRLSVCVGDTKSRTVTARFFSGGEPVPLTAAYLRGLRADGAQIYAACAVADGAATYTFTTSDLSVGGTLMCEFDLHNGDAVMTSPRFAVLCGKPVYTGEGAEGSDEYAAYIAALLKLENLTVTAEAGDAAAATATVSDAAVQLHFVLPKGDKGDKGDTGEKGNVGEKGDPGADGKTPVKGVDYWTAADVAEMDAAKDAAAQAAEDANDAASSAVDAAGSAYFAADSATAAAASAASAAQEANSAVAEMQAKADAGDFDGAKGDPGKDGYTPVRGTDYWTDDDKAAMNATYANAVKTTVRGASISVSDVSPFAHPVTVKVHSKNIIPYPYVNTTKTDNGITWTDNGDGTVTASGTATKDSFFTFTYTAAPYTSGKYTLSGCPSGGTGKTYYIYTFSPADNARLATDYGDGAAAAYDSAKTYRVYAMVASGATVDNLVFRPQLAYGTTVANYTSYVSDLTDMDVDVRRLPTDDEMQTYTPSADGTVADVTCLSPNMAISTSRADDVVIEMTYNRNAAEAIAGLQRVSDALSKKVTLLKEITTTEAATAVELLPDTKIKNFLVDVEIAQAAVNSSAQLLLAYTDGSNLYCTLSSSVRTDRSNKSSFVGFDIHGVQSVFCRNTGTYGMGSAATPTTCIHAGDNTIKKIRYQAINSGATVPAGSKFAIYGILED